MLIIFKSLTRGFCGGHYVLSATVISKAGGVTLSRKGRIWNRNHGITVASGHLFDTISERAHEYDDGMTNEQFKKMQEFIVIQSFPFKKQTSLLGILQIRKPTMP
ncbi:hypothetical protein Vadar_020512 [Vaccinium darrowii]|uniref:Uncharacterized protein n=1 Tax=Vaccinium darrowii TaxID=229202 RepID=A0ACB7XT90_9ERIC|nr:hypothetical protein Vadar_020512 [Vaccinium darrowii]